MRQRLPHGFLPAIVACFALAGRSDEGDVLFQPRDDRARIIQIALEHVVHLPVEAAVRQVRKRHTEAAQHLAGRKQAALRVAQTHAVPP